jgi:hypothetical protein
MTKHMQEGNEMDKGGNTTQEKRIKQNKIKIN